MLKGTRQKLFPSVVYVEPSWCPVNQLCQPSFCRPSAPWTIFHPDGKIDLNIAQSLLRYAPSVSYPLADAFTPSCHQVRDSAPRIWTVAPSRQPVFRSPFSPPHPLGVQPRTPHFAPTPPPRLQTENRECRPRSWLVALIPEYMPDNTVIVTPPAITSCRQVSGLPPNRSNGTPCSRRFASSPTVDRHSTAFFHTPPPPIVVPDKFIRLRRTPPV